MCGEHDGVQAILTTDKGSSPHVRGARMVAGRHSTPSRDHPRMCGEHYILNGGQFIDEGSSPHVRGAQFSVKVCQSTSGIIPACAGSTG